MVATGISNVVLKRSGTARGWPSTRPSNEKSLLLPSSKGSAVNWCRAPVGFTTTFTPRKLSGPRLNRLETLEPVVWASCSTPLIISTKMGRLLSPEFRSERGASARKNTPVRESLSFKSLTTLPFTWGKAAGAATKQTTIMTARRRQQLRRFGIMGLVFAQPEWGWPGFPRLPAPPPFHRHSAKARQIPRGPDYAPFSQDFPGETPERSEGGE